jgi:hypothetical protein
MINDRPDLSSEGAHAIDKTILVNVNRNKYSVVRRTWALKPGLTDRLVVGRNVTLTMYSSCHYVQPVSVVMWPSSVTSVQLHKLVHCLYSTGSCNAGLVLLYLARLVKMRHSQTCDVVQTLALY